MLQSDSESEAEPRRGGQARARARNRRVRRVSRLVFVCFPPPSLPRPSAFLLLADAFSSGYGLRSAHDHATTRRPIRQRAFKPPCTFHSQEEHPWPRSHVSRWARYARAVSNTSWNQPKAVSYAFSERQPPAPERKQAAELRAYTHAQVSVGSGSSFSPSASSVRDHAYARCERKNREVNSSISRNKPLARRGHVLLEPGCR